MVAPMIIVATIFGIAEFGRTMIERRNLVLLVVGAAHLTDQSTRTRSRNMGGGTRSADPRRLPIQPVRSRMAWAMRYWGCVRGQPSRSPNASSYARVPSSPVRTRITM